MADLEVEFYEHSGRKPIETFLGSLDTTKKLAMLAAIEQVLAKQGIGVCKSSWGKNLGKGLFEFRVRHTVAEIRNMFGGDPPARPDDQEGPPGKILLRAFCHAYGDRVILLLGGYDKGKDPSSKRQQKEIALARKRLKAFQTAQKQAATRKGRR